MPDHLKRFVVELTQDERAALLRQAWGAAANRDALISAARRLEEGSPGIAIAALRQIAALGASEPLLPRRGRLHDETGVRAIAIAQNALERLEA